jgi:hypothetical protein
MSVSVVWVVLLVACISAGPRLAAAQGLPDDGGGVVGSAEVSAALRATYRRSSTWQTSYKLSPRAACSGSSGSLCAASDTQDELTIAELQLAATPSYYDARLLRFTGPFQAHAPPQDQGSCFTCATFSVIGAAEAAVASALRVNASSVQLSKQQLAYCLPSTTGLTRNCRTAWSLREAINALVAAFKGPRQMTTSSCLPYQNAAQVQQPRCKAACGPPDDDASGLLNGAFTAQRLQTAWEVRWLGCSSVSAMHAGAMCQWSPCTSVVLSEPLLSSAASFRECLLGITSPLIGDIRLCHAADAAPRHAAWWGHQPPDSLQRPAPLLCC